MIFQILLYLLLLINKIFLKYASAAFFIGTEDVRVDVSNCYFHNVSSPVGTIVYSANLGKILL